MRYECYRVLVVACVVAGWCASASAQTFYKWTDNRGIVHFSDQPPSNAQNVEERHLPGVAEEPAAGGSESGEAAQAAATPAEGAPSGPSKVILVARQNPRTGPSAMHIIGQVKNVGGADAQGVTVTISAVDSTQGTPCLHEDAAVTPSTLHPGDTGNFDVQVDSPCLFGEPNLDVTPVWQ